MAEMTNDQFLAALRATQHFSGARSQFEEMYTAARALEPAPVKGDAVEAAIDTLKGMTSWRLNGYAAIFRQEMSRAIAAADAARGRAYIEWRDDMEKAPPDRAIWLGQRGAHMVYSAWRGGSGGWQNIPRGWTPDCWAEIVLPPARVVRNDRGAKLDRADDAESDTFEQRAREVSGWTKEDIDSALFANLQRRTFEEVLSVLIKLTDKYGWPQATSTGLKYLRVEWEKRDG